MNILNFRSDASERTIPTGNRNMNRMLHRSKTSGLMKCLSTLVAAATLLSPSGLLAGSLPSGARIIKGKVSISTNGNTMQIDQASRKAIVNWQEFSIGEGYGVNVKQPSASAAMLARVVGQDPSNILGNLNANGHFYLVNPNGILFGQNAIVNVHALVASTLDISDQNFMDGKLLFEGNSKEAIINLGQINADAAALIGNNVLNAGTINAKQVGLLGTSSIELGNFNGGKLSVDFSGLADADKPFTQVINAGSVNAADGDAILFADAGLADNSQGTLTASTAEISGKYVDILNLGTLNVASLLIDPAGTLTIGDNVTDNVTDNMPVFIKQDDNNGNGWNVGMVGSDVGHYDYYYTGVVRSYFDQNRDFQVTAPTSTGYSNEDPTLATDETSYSISTATLENMLNINTGVSSLTLNYDNFVLGDTNLNSTKGLTLATNSTTDGEILVVGDFKFNSTGELNLIAGKVNFDATSSIVGGGDLNLKAMNGSIDSASVTSAGTINLFASNGISGAKNGSITGVALNALTTSGEIDFQGSIGAKNIALQAMGDNAAVSIAKMNESPTSLVIKTTGAFMANTDDNAILSADIMAASADIGAGNADITNTTIAANTVTVTGGSIGLVTKNAAKAYLTADNGADTATVTYRNYAAADSASLGLEIGGNAKQIYVEQNGAGMKNLSIKSDRKSVV